MKGAVPTLGIIIGCDAELCQLQARPSLPNSFFESISNK